jgi:hypothetical protein
MSRLNYMMEAAAELHGVVGADASQSLFNTAEMEEIRKQSSWSCGMTPRLAALREAGKMVILQDKKAITPKEACAFLEVLEREQKEEVQLDENGKKIISWSKFHENKKKVQENNMNVHESVKEVKPNNKDNVVTQVLGRVKLRQPELPAEHKGHSAPLKTTVAESRGLADELLGFFETVPQQRTDTHNQKLMAMQGDPNKDGQVRPFIQTPKTTTK